MVRVRVPGGQTSGTALRELSRLAQTYGSGLLQLTSRASLQVRGLPEAVPEPFEDAVARAGFLPSARHERVRNVVASPLTGLVGGRADLRPLVARLDRALIAEPRLADLPGRFLFVLDDGRGDVADRPCDLGLVALDAATAQLRVGDAYGPAVALACAAAELAGLAVRFLAARGTGPTAPWHVRELPRPLVEPAQPDQRLPSPAPAPAFGEIAGGRHVAVPGGVLDRALAETLAAAADALVVTPWHGILIPSTESA